MTTYAEFDEFADQIGERRRRAERLTPPLLLALGLVAGPAPDVGGRAPATPVRAASHLLADTLDDLGRAEEELRTQNEALFAARTELEHEQQALRDLFDFAPAAYVVTNAGGVLVRLNQAALTLLARPANVAVGKPLAAYVALADRTAFRTALARVVGSGRTETWRVRFVPRAGEPVECRVHARAVRPPSRSAPSVLHWVITEEPWELGDDLV